MKEILIDLEYVTSNESIGKRRASFEVNEKKFAVNPNLEAVRLTYQWFDRVRREYPYDIEVKSVKYNTRHDITAGLQAVLDKEKRIAFEDWKAPWE